MNKPFAVIAMAIALTAMGTASAAMDHSSHDSMNNSQMAQMSGHDMSKMSDKSMAMTEGVVKKVDAAAGKVTLQHAALTNLDMPAMTMVFRLKDPAWANEMKVGDKIKFVAENPGGVLTVVQYEKAK